MMIEVATVSLVVGFIAFLRYRVEVMRMRKPDNTDAEIRERVEQVYRELTAKVDNVGERVTVIRKRMGL